MYLYNTYMYMYNTYMCVFTRSFLLSSYGNPMNVMLCTHSLSLSFPLKCMCVYIACG